MKFFAALPYTAAVPAIPGIRVVRSPIHGYGVVATRAFALGERICDVDGILWHASEAQDDRYSLWVDGDFYFDMVDQTRFINHSCDPNAEIDAELDGNGGAWATVVALRAIAADEELTYDYAFPAALAEPCSCGARNCRGYIVDADEQGLVRR